MEWNGMESNGMEWNGIEYLGKMATGRLFNEKNLKIFSLYSMRRRIGLSHPFPRTFINYCETK